jgi:foldase protein PrsA
LVLVLLLLSGCGGGQTLATYQGGKVTAKEFDQYINIQSFIMMNPNLSQTVANDQKAHDQLMNQLIAEKIIAEQVKDDDFKKQANQMMDNLLKTYEMQLGSEGKVRQMMNISRIDSNAVKNELVRTAKLQRYFTDQAGGEEQLKDYFEMHKENYTKATVRHILFLSGSTRSDEEALKMAEDVKKKLNNGGDFTELAKQYSEDTGSKDNGGKYEDYYVGDWVEPFKKAVLTLPLNKVSDPVKTSYGYHLIEVLKRTPGSYEDAKDRVKSDAVNQAYQDWMEKQLPKYLNNTGGNK